MRTELEARHHSEVATAAAQSPEQLGIVLVARSYDAPVRGHHVGGDQVVAPKALRMPQPTVTTSGGEPADAGRRHDSEGNREPVPLRSNVDVADHRAAAGTHHAAPHIDDHSVQVAEID